MNYGMQFISEFTELFKEKAKKRNYKLGPIDATLFRSVLKINTSKRRRTVTIEETPERKRASKGKEKVTELEGEEGDDFLAQFDYPGGRVAGPRRKPRKKRAIRKKRRPTIRASLVKKLRAAKKRAANAFRNAERDLIALKAQKGRTIFVKSQAIKAERFEL